LEKKMTKRKLVILFTIAAAVPLAQETANLQPSAGRSFGLAMSDRTLYAGKLPNSNESLFTTPADAPGRYHWDKAIEYCRNSKAFGHHDWRVPTKEELAVLFDNRAAIGSFNLTGLRSGGWYWSSSTGYNTYNAWAQRFNDGLHGDEDKDTSASLRCVRG
jgi:hypothetical protein